MLRPRTCTHLALAVRTAYGVIGVFEATGNNILTSMWSPLFGSATAFALMALLPEYIVLAIFIYLGHYRIRTCSDPNWVDDRPPKKSVKEHLKDEQNKLKSKIDQGVALSQMGRGEVHSAERLDSVERAERGQNRR